MIGRSLVWAALLLASCGSESTPAWPDVAEPAAASEDWCARVAAGPADTAPSAVGLSAAHATVRFFGPQNYRDADLALAAALGGADPLGAGLVATLGAYDGALPGLCVLPAGASTLGPVTVELVDGVAFVTPGTGDLALPAEARAVAIDLRGLPETPGLNEALARVAAVALPTNVAALRLTMRSHKGMVDEVTAAGNSYTSTTGILAAALLAGKAAKTLPLAVLTDADLAPAAARFAFALRLSGRAWLLGEDVRTEVAEARWLAVGAYGVVARTGVLVDTKNNPFPDVLRADLRTVDPRATAAGLLGRGTPGAPSFAGTATRPRVLAVEPFGDVRPAAVGSGELLAGLIITHGALRRFFTYFDVVGDRIDGRLVELVAQIAAAPPTSRLDMIHVLQRFSEAISDGHSAVKDATEGVAGVLPVILTEVGGEPVVRRSLEPKLRRGDAIVAVDGTPIASWLATELARTSAATEGYRFVLATQRLLSLKGPITLDVRAPDGKVRTETVDPQPAGPAIGYAPEVRVSGFLTDLGAPTIYYLNLADDVLMYDSQVVPALKAAVDGNATGLIVDMRGYASGNPSVLAALIGSATVISPRFDIPNWSGPDAFSFDTQQSTVTSPSNPKPKVPTVLLVGPRTVSASETFALMAIDSLHPTIVGQTSAGTDGDITGLQLPGGFTFTFTGLRLLRPNGDRFHGVGIVPDVIVKPTAAALAAGQDPELAAAIATSTGGGVLGFSSR